MSELEPVSKAVHYEGVTYIPVADFAAGCQGCCFNVTHHDDHTCGRPGDTGESHAMFGCIPSQRPDGLNIRWKVAPEVISYHEAPLAAASDYSLYSLCKPEEPVAGLKHEASSTQVAGDHYTSTPIQPWDVIDTWPLQQRIGYYRGNALKYIMRAGKKESNTELQEFQKAEHYLQKLAEVLKEPLG